jgi:hypothetical protein
MPIRIDTRYRPKGYQSKSQKSRRNRGRIYRTSKMSIPRKIPLALQQHSFVERKTTDLVMTVDTEAAAVGLFKSFNLNDINNAASYKTLFEYYRIDKIVVNFRYKATGSAAAAGSSHGYAPNEVNPLLYFKVDHNDISADSLSLMRESMKTKEKQLTNNEPNFTITLKPAVQSEAYHTALASTYVPKWGQWLSTDDGSVPHYGLKAYAVGFKDANFGPGQIVVSIKYYVSFKNNE